jgi:H+-transporting ATPase
MPEHKFAIVQSLRDQGHVTGMTGDGVNDAPALKRADIGIAVHGATDAAKAAAAIVLTEPGLSVIIDAIFRSRKIFQRMRNYCVYRISCTLQLLFFFFFAIICFDPSSSYFYGTVAPGINPDLDRPAAFTLPVLSLVIITILNDGTMITISHDKVIPEKIPQRWAMFEVSVISIVLSLVACLSSLILLLLLMHSNAAHPGGFIGAVFGSAGRDYVLFDEVQTMIYLKISLSDFLTLFAARTRTFFWERRPGYLLGVAALFATGSSTLLALFWDDIFTGGDLHMAGLRHSKYACVAVWIYCVLWFLLQDLAKVLTYQLLSYLQKDEVQKLEDVKQRGQIGSKYESINKQARKQGLASRTAKLNLEDEASSEVVAELQAKLKQQGDEIAALRDVIIKAGLLPAGTTSAAAAKSHH